MRLTAAAVTVIGSLASALPALADFGAIAWDERNCAVGRSWHYDSPRQAAERALAECGHAGCRVVLEVGSGQCGALAVTPNCHGYGWARRESRDAARYSAMVNCQNYNAGQCSIRTVDCNR
jgi:hypothetical protein